MGPADAAATGAAAEVPKNGSNTLVVAPSGAKKLTLPAGIGRASRFPLASNNIDPGPTDENASAMGAPPNAGGLSHATAPTALAPATISCPLMVPDPVPALGSLICAPLP